MYLKFYSKTRLGKGRCLSNFSDHQIKIGTNTYKTGEHAFHGEKFRSLICLTNDEMKKSKLKECADRFCTDFSNPVDAKRAGGKRGIYSMNEEEQDYWKKQSIEVQKQICSYKKETYPEIQEFLETHKQFILIHQDNFANAKTIWGAKVKDDKIIGMNKLGKIWMFIREKY